MYSSSAASGTVRSLSIVIALEIDGNQLDGSCSASCAARARLSAATFSGCSAETSRCSVGSARRSKSQRRPGGSLTLSFQPSTSAAREAPLRQNSSRWGTPVASPRTKGSRSTPSTIRSSGSGAPAAAAAVAKMSK
jgi:hypothetical protein